MHKVIADKKGGVHVELSDEEKKDRLLSEEIAKKNIAERESLKSAKEARMKAACEKLEAMGLSKEEVAALFT